MDEARDVAGERTVRPTPNGPHDHHGTIRVGGHPGGARAMSRRCVGTDHEQFGVVGGSRAQHVGRVARFEP